MTEHAIENTAAGTTNEGVLMVPGMGSDHCAGIVRAAVERLDDIESTRTNIADHCVIVTTTAGGPDGETLRTAVEGAGYDVAAIPIAAIGLLHPMIGVIAMTASSLSVIGNPVLL